MYWTYLAPKEHPPTSLIVKRALLTYDKVILPDPGDRDLFAPRLYLQAMELPPILG